MPVKSPGLGKLEKAARTHMLNGTRLLCGELVWDPEVELESCYNPRLGGNFFLRLSSRRKPPHDTARHLVGLKSHRMGS